MEPATLIASAIVTASFIGDVQYWYLCRWRGHRRLIPIGWYTYLCPYCRRIIRK